MRVGSICVLPVLLLSCSKTENAPSAPPEASDPSQVISSPAIYRDVGVSPGWELLSSGEGVALVLKAADKQVMVRLFCPSGENVLKVNVQGIRPISSEERLTIGSGSTAVTLVAPTGGDPLLGGVSGTGKVPGELATLLDGRVSVNYGAQNSGPHIAPPQTLAKAFVTACNDRLTSTEGTQQSVKVANACMVQDGKPLGITPRRAIGTEPFWGARIEGRCVHYSHMEDQKGKRVWTRYARNDVGELWSGTLNGNLFELILRNEPGCSDGMSDKRYPSSVELKLGTELRRGCAEPD